MLRKLTTYAAVVALLASTSVPALAGDTMMDWGGSRTNGPAAMAYFKVPFHATEARENPYAGFALTGIAGRSGQFGPSLFDAPKVMDFRLSGYGDQTMYVAGAVAWDKNPSTLPGYQKNLFGMGTADTGLAVVAAGAAVWGIVELADSEDEDDDDDDD
jgi:hypothetical protein